MTKTKTTHEYDLEGALHTVIITSSEPVLLSWNHDPVDVLSGRNKLTVRGSGKLSIDNPHKGVVNFHVKTKGTSETEQIDDRDIPAPPSPNNMLQMLRAKVRAEIGVTREAFTGITSPYETDNALFEEDLAQMAEDRRPVDPPPTAPPAAASAEGADTSNE
ncbi:hypothetical protein [Microviridae sp.]|nr:hypothetical protein [Microviridae sp.]